MHWSDLEIAFQRAVLLSVNKKKLIITFPVLILCGILCIFCRAVSFGAGEWVAMSFSFLPFLLSSGVLFVLGMLLIRIHHSEVKQIALDFKSLISSSADLLLATSYFAVLPILAYLFLWTILGIFFLFKEIPGLGNFFSVVFSFGPFLLIFGSILLCLANIGLLFFVAPAVALQPLNKIPLHRRIWKLINQKLFTAFLLFFIAMIPTVLIGGLALLAATLTDVNFVVAGSLSTALQWFFIMLPFSAILAPAVIFFFNFASESFQLLQKASVPIYGEKSREAAGV